MTCYSKIPEIMLRETYSRFTPIPNNNKQPNTILSTLSYSFLMCIFLFFFVNYHFSRNTHIFFHFSYNRGEMTWKWRKEKPLFRASYAYMKLHQYYVLHLIISTKLTNIDTDSTMKTSRNCKWLPRKHLIGCWGVKLFLRNDFCQRLFYCLEFEFLILS